MFPNEIYRESIANEVWVSVHPPLLRSVRKGKEVIAMIFKNQALGEADIYMTPQVTSPYILTNYIGAE